MAEFLLNAAQADLAASIREMVEQCIMPHALDMDIRGDDSLTGALSNCSPSTTCWLPIYQWNWAAGAWTF